MAHVRLTRVQRLLARKPSPLRPSNVPQRGGCIKQRIRFNPIEYSLLQPRSALIAAPPRVAPKRLLSMTITSFYTTTCLCKIAIRVVEPLCDDWLGHRPFSEPLTSAGELLHIPKRIPTFMATVLLSRASNILCGFCV